MVGVCWISGGVRAWLQETYPVCRSHSEYPGQTSRGACRWHWDYSAPHAQHLSGRSRRPQAGCRRWMPDVVRQLVGIGMVQWPVINRRGLQCAQSRMEKGSMWTRCTAMFGPCYRLLWLSANDSTWFCRQCISKSIIRPKVGLCSVPVVLLRRIKDGAKRLFHAGVGQNRGAPTNWNSQYFCCDRCLWCIRMHSGC